MEGRLYIYLTVDFPGTGSLMMDNKKALEAILPPRPLSQLTDMELDECKETTLHDINLFRVVCSPLHYDNTLGGKGYRLYYTHE